MPSATAKRTRRIAFEEDGDDDGVVVAEASSSLRSDTQRKKARMSAAHQQKGSMRDRRQQSEETSSEEDEAMQEPSPAPEIPAASQFEHERDLDFEHLRHAEEDDLRATQRLKSRPELIGENHAALNAVIESIEVYNFMCHERLRVDLGPLLNFIVGENGSGKSAILTAITLCLGGKASSTNRGASLKSFIKEGKEHGVLIVKIKNQGPDAYKPDLFGDSIIVERHFNKSGSSGFKLKSATGRVMSTKRDDVQDIVEYYCLQVDNPLNVLSQDNARQFLNSATPAQKYNYFLQGTQLQQLSDDLLLIHEHIDATEAKLFGFEENFTAIKAEMEKYKKLKEIAGKNEEFRRKQKVYVRQLAWAQVREQEVILHERENAINAFDEELQGLERRIQAAAEELEKHDRLVESAKDELEELRQEESELQRKKEEAKEAYDKARAAVHQLHIQEREVHGQLTNANNGVKECKKKIKAEERRLEEVNGGALAEKQQALDDAREAVESASKVREENGTELPTLEEKFAEAEQRAQEAGKPVEDKKREVSATESRIRTLTQNRGDPLAGFYPQTRQLLKLIEQDNGFSRKPIGPIGLHVQLQKPAWSSILETTFGETLDAFIVTNPGDRERLAGHMARLKYNKQPTIFISHPGRVIKNLNEPDERFDTILRVLKFDNDQVRNQLVMTNQIENILLIEDLSDAFRVMGDRQPQHAKLSISFHPSKRGHGTSLKPGRGNNLNQEPINASERRRMQSDSESQMNHQKDLLAQLKSDLRDLESIKKGCHQEAQRCSQAVTQHKRRGEGLKKKIREAEARVSVAEQALDAYDGTDMRLQGLREELQKAQASEGQYGQQYGELAVEKNDLNVAATAAKTELERARMSRNDFDERIKKATDKVSRLEGLRRITVQEKNAAHQDVEEAKVGKESAERSRDRQVRQLQEHIEGAQAVHPERVHIPEEETYQSIELKFTKIKDQLARFKDRHGMDEHQINEKAAASFAAFDEARKFRRDCELDVRASKHALTKRLDKWRMFQRMISAAARTNFAYLLSERAFRGRLLLDHANKKLAIEVEPDQTRQDVSGRNTKTLSGGEKSFSSICLLLAIWEAMGSPLRCLDEFDVFMDVINRAISTKMLVQAARRSVGKQFILITPNAIEGNVKYDKDVKIIRLTDPRQKRLTDSH
ncbi:DNA repair protein [Seiridium cupressi]